MEVADGAHLFEFCAEGEGDVGHRGDGGCAGVYPG